ncbi:MAG TPA: DNA repair protein RecO [Chloroflexota bacterium]|nr:DNA repair protein RecO [Chloroflexota bacterium]
MRADAVVLRRHDFGEADRIITLFTENLGKMRAVAKGVRRPTSRLGGHLELFSRIQVMLARGRNLETITQVEMVDPFVGIRDDLWRTGLAYYVAELLDRLTEEHAENRELYRAVVAALGRIATSDRPSEALHHFEVRALDLLGYRPELKVCVRCRQSLLPHGNAFSAVSGGILCGNCRVLAAAAPDISANAIRMLRLYLTDDWSTTLRLRIDSGLAEEVASILRVYTHSVAESALKSDRFVQELRREYNAGVPLVTSAPTLTEPS